MGHGPKSIDNIKKFHFENHNILEILRARAIATGEEKLFWEIFRILFLLKMNFLKHDYNVAKFQLRLIQN